MRYLKQEGYDFYGDVQLKSGFGKNTNIGEHVPEGMKDGVYIGYGGIAVVINGILVATFDKLINRFGEKIETDLVVF